jgi:AhpD family alkylhydroperoxidase
MEGAWMNVDMDMDRYARIAPGVVRALLALGAAVDESGLDKDVTELLKIRISQLNGCAFCLQYHVNLARRQGVAAGKLDQVAAWRDAPGFSPRERAALAWSEALTTMGQAHVDRAVYTQLCGEFDAAEVAHLTAAVGAINAWNRIAGGLRFTPPASV